MSAKGFEAPGTGNALNFAGTKYEGLEVTVDSVPFGMLMAVMGDYEAATSGALTSAQAMPLIDRLIDRFGELLESWNVTRRGEPVPPTAEGLRSLDAAFVLEIMGAWLTGSVQADEELGKDSGSGGTSAAELEAMAALSASLPSSSPQRL